MIMVPLKNKIPFPLILVTRLVRPLQGLFNIIVYTRPHIKKLMDQDDSCTYLQALLKVVKLGGDDDKNEAERRARAPRSPRTPRQSRGDAPAPNVALRGTPDRDRSTIGRPESNSEILPDSFDAMTSRPGLINAGFHHSSQESTQSPPNQHTRAPDRISPMRLAALRYQNKIVVKNRDADDKSPTSMVEMSAWNDGVGSTETKRKSGGGSEDIETGCS
mmetsp:Transcript_18876/g.27585  ORF Transcript_18876/g.27585 Transcript_18876/m.27585 type:complete len:218 (+) Transcript_18876:40-693(+)|eukprot:CAMPEP_0197250374 /NCGR_PEP_ID=MMETSP1429-20130617/52525_1 /TAXON_ID=49237 /ORGANISM="Chaetoceros  sp., Strain UNC1202" /LENGTH=217 /DNA_ID=CAMNT_0042712185 /DNA_START=29 /DNA_END=682 /DNA_ORIENTATION=+